MWRSKPEMVTRDTALVGRSEPVPVPERHAVLKTPLTPPWPAAASWPAGTERRARDVAKGSPTRRPLTPGAPHVAQQARDDHR